MTAGIASDELPSEPQELTPNGLCPQAQRPNRITEVICERHPHGWIGFRHSGAYVAKFFMKWKEGNQPKFWRSGKKTAGYFQVIQLKGNAHDIKITAQAATGLAWNPWGTIFKLKLAGPPNKVYVARGTTLKRKWKTADK